MISKKQTKQCAKNTLHRDNCDRHIRKIVINNFGDTFVLSGTHGFEWSITTIKQGVVSQTIYPNRQSALKQFKNIIK